MTERLYYTDSLLTHFNAAVTDVQEFSRSNGQSIWRIALDRTAFYPTSGGQPFDMGHLIATARSGAELAAEIVNVEEDATGQVWHHTAKPLQAGTSVRGEVDWQRRQDHMQQHSGQHLLSAAFVENCEAATVSFHLGEETSTIDLDIEHLSTEALLAVQERANQIIAEDRPVNIASVSQEQAAAWLASGVLRKLPARDGDIRIITITDFDRNACGGTHVRTTGQIGGLHLRNMEKVRQGVRVEFVCGLRAMRMSRRDFETLTAAGKALSVSTPEIPEAIARLQTQNKQAGKERAALLDRIAGYQVAELLREHPRENNPRYIRLTLAPPDAPDTAFVKMLASKIAASSSQTIALLAWQPAANPEEPATVIFSCSKDVALDCGALLRQAVTAHGGRGGGSKDMAQGSVAPSALADVLETLAASTG
ncbi:MAG TPA: alanine--tRNA ligase-related protein [Acidobacteriaceae bacterium]|jgi:alanyl-tRNA synthetase|nr:alanine--tRNA ligase-related protein [Acidobacteriaceae bacterium]